MKVQKNHKKFLRLFVVLALVSTVPAILNYNMLRNASEMTPYPELVKIQQAEGAILGMGLTQNSFRYKLELIRHRKPNVVVLGSSRVLQVREEFFEGSFVNAGGMNYLNEARFFVEEMVKFHRPDLLLVGLDHWWFNNDYYQPKAFPRNKITAATVSGKKLAAPFKMLLRGAITPDDFIKISLNKKDNSVTAFKKIGLIAIINSNGFREDGSYLTSKELFGQEPKRDFSKFRKALLSMLGENIIRPQYAGFKGTLEKIQAGTYRFAYGNEVGIDRKVDLAHIIRLAKENNINLILYSIPNAPIVTKELERKSNKYGYIKEFRKFLTTLPVESYDFHEPSEIDAPDCEYRDGFHLGEIAYLRLLGAILDRNPDSSLGKHLKMDLLKKVIKDFAGKALYVEDPSKYIMKETDFLELGCKK